MGIKIVDWYSEHVNESMNVYSHGDRMRGWTKLVKWAIFVIAAIIAILLFFMFGGWWGLLGLALIVIIIEIILRFVDKHSN